MECKGGLICEPVRINSKNFTTDDTGTQVTGYREGSCLPDGSFSHREWRCGIKCNSVTRPVFIGENQPPATSA